jgi:hypothetical protein
MKVRLDTQRLPGRLASRGSGKLSKRAAGLAAITMGLLATGISSAGAVSGVPTCPLPAGSTAYCQVDPSTVAQGELALESSTDTSFKIDVSGHMQHFRKGAEVTVEHFQFAAPGDPNQGDVSGWHKHAGPIFVEILTGTLTAYQATDKKCLGVKYSAGMGFVEPGGVIHDVRNEVPGTTVDIYDTAVLPPGSGDAGIFIPEPDNSNPNCPFSR